MLKGGITWKGKARTMVNMQGENVKARAYVISYDPPKGAKRPFRRLMVPFYRLQNAFDNKGAVAVHHGGTSRYQGISLSEKREKLSDGGETTVTRAGEFALWEVPFRSKKGKAKPKPKFWAARENGMIVTDDDNKPLYPSDDKGHELFVEVDPKKLPIVVVFEGASYPALIGYNYPDMCRILRPTLELIAVSRGGPVNIDMAAARARGVKVVNAPGRNASAVAEFTIGAILAETRLIRAGHEALRQGEWRGDLYRADRTGEELSAMTVGVIGYGQIGARVVRLLKPFGCRILVDDPYKQLSALDRADGIEAVDLETLLRQSDVVTLHARVTEETRGFLGRREFALMKPGSYFVNTARGPMVEPPVAGHRPATARVDARNRAAARLARHRHVVDVGVQHLRR